MEYINNPWLQVLNTIAFKQLIHRKEIEASTLKATKQRRRKQPLILSSTARIRRQLQVDTATVNNKNEAKLNFITQKNENQIAKNEGN